MIRQCLQIVVTFGYFSPMIFEHHPPFSDLQGLVKEIWIYENEDDTPAVQKVIPDGYSEIIIHYGDPYKIKIADQWEIQSPILFSSQISHYFSLENTGKSGMIGIKLFPTTFFELFQIDIAPFSNQVISLAQIIPDLIGQLSDIKHQKSTELKVQAAQDWLISHLPKRKTSKTREAVELILEKKGLLDFEQLESKTGLSSRQIERVFKKEVGLTPKFYSRIIRFNYIFEVMKNEKDSWVKTALQSGYFDQSHFIKNFKEFTGEEPSSYGFDEVNLANFFLIR